MVIHHFELINGILIGLLISAFALTVWEVDIYEKTFIPLKLPFMIWLMTGLAFTPIFRKTLTVYLTPLIFLQIGYNVLTWGGLAIFGFMYTNYNFASKAEATINENIISTGHLNSRSGSARPYIIIIYNEQEKQLVYYWNTQVELYKSVDLTISQGLFGFDIVRNSEFKSK